MLALLFGKQAAALLQDVACVTDQQVPRLHGPDAVRLGHLVIATPEVVARDLADGRRRDQDPLAGVSVRLRVARSSVPVVQYGA